MTRTTWMRLLLLVAILSVQCSMFHAYAQITIGGNVYGGGNAGDMSGNTSVTVRAGDIHGGVYGGARQANVGGHAFVNIDGEHMSDDIVINYVYGGNDIAGNVGESIKETDPIPAKLTEEQMDAAANGITPAKGETNAGKNTKKYCAFVRKRRRQQVQVTPPSQRPLSLTTSSSANSLAVVMATILIPLQLMMMETILLLMPKAQLPIVKCR